MWDDRLPRSRARVAILLMAFVPASMFPDLCSFNSFLSNRHLIPRINADATAQALPFSQDWTDAGLVTADDDWGGVAGVVGYLGDISPAAAADVDPQTVLVDNLTVDVIANINGSPSGVVQGGVAEFQGAPFMTVALQGSGTADAPNIVISVDTTGKTDITISYNLRDVDGSADNAAQQVALQYRVGDSGNFTNIPEGYVPDATTGPNQATLVTPVGVLLPAAAINKPLVQLRIITTNAGGNDEWVGIDDISITGVEILHAEMEGFAATGSAGHALLEWRTGMEVDSLGFNIYREDEGRRSRVNGNILAGSALLAGPGVTLGAGRSYSFRDPAPSHPGTLYFIEAIDLNGASVYHGPVALDMSGDEEPDPKAGHQARVLSMLASSGESDDATKPVEPRAPAPSGSPAQLDAQARLAGSPSVKLAVEDEGFYRITREQLVSEGLSPRADARRLQLYVDGTEQAISVVGQSGASFRAIEFYGRGLDDYSSRRRVYWLTEGDRAGARIRSVRTKGSVGPNTSSTSFLSEVERAERSVYFSSLRNGEAENFFGAVVVRDPVEQNIRLRQVDRSDGKEASLEVALQGVTLNHHRYRVEVNGRGVGRVEFDGHQLGVLRAKLAQSLLEEGDNSVRVVSESGETTVSTVRRIGVNYWKMYRADSDELTFTADGRIPVKVAGFSANRIRVLDVTDERRVKEVRGEISREGGGYSIRVGGAASGARRLLAYVEGREKAVAEARGNAASDLMKPAPGADYVVISHADMKESVSGLKRLREGEGLKVKVVDVEDVYDEYSFGHKSAVAIRRFIEDASAGWETKPRYVLLVGDGSFDPKDYLQKGARDFIPAKMVDTARMETASDEWYVEGAGTPIAIGRLAVKTAEEAARMADKIVRYEEGAGSRGEGRGVLLVSDSGTNNEFERESEKLKALAGDGAQEIRRARMGSAAAKDELMWALARGQKLVNYIGHGSLDIWRGDVMTGEDARRLGNRDSLSVYVLMTCLNGYFEDAEVDSIAEALMKAEGGAALVWASSGLTELTAQARLNEGLFRELFSGAGVRIGDAVVKAKAGLGDADAGKTWVIFGDPATRLK
ncbi:MAG TPA: C25 family cysteine peptidase [Blastocatellia bacterium]|nr:C25 family cysteine peptidase [Blastocatellia bacterium]